jgi:hypothetical protein
MRLRPPDRPPRAVTAAIRLMCAAAVAELAALITIVVTAGSVRASVTHRYPAFKAVLTHVVNIHLAIDEIGAPICIVLWLWLAWATSRRRDPVRAAYALFFLLNTVGMIIGVAQGAVVYAPADMAAFAVVWLIGLAAMVLILTPASSRYYRPQAVAPAPWRGTFGTA